MPIASAFTAPRQLRGKPVVESIPGSARNSGTKPSRKAIFCQSVAKWPVSYIRTASPGLITLANAASHAPVPDAA